MKIKITKPFNGETSATVFKGIFGKKEIARIGLIFEPSLHYYQVDYFLVKQNERGRGWGRKLMELMVREVAEAGGKELKVYPKSEPYDGDSFVLPEHLYMIYEHLGFWLVEEKADRRQPNHEMILKIESVN